MFFNLFEIKIIKKVKRKKISNAKVKNNTCPNCGNRLIRSNTDDFSDPCDDLDCDNCGFHTVEFVA